MPEAQPKAAAMKQPHCCHESGANALFALPAHWTPEQALAVFEYIELVRDQLWLAYGPNIQLAWANQLVTERPPPDLDPDAPF